MPKPPSQPNLPGTIQGFSCWMFTPPYRSPNCCDCRRITQRLLSAEAQVDRSSSLRPKLASRAAHDPKHPCSTSFDRTRSSRPRSIPGLPHLIQTLAGDCIHCSARCHTLPASCCLDRTDRHTRQSIELRRRNAEGRVLHAERIEQALAQEGINDFPETRATKHP